MNLFVRKRILSDEFSVPAELNLSHFPSLDGIRAISVFIVLIAHFNASFQNKVIISLFSGGTLGVYIFFVISGFLITSLLLKEKIETGTISLKKFYIRRSLRILPVAYLYLGVLVVLHLFGGLPLQAIEIFGALLFMVNLGYFHTNEFTGHYWSLSVEEQFYLIFPFILKQNYRLYINFLLTLLILILVFRSIDFLALRKTSHYRLFTLLNLVNDFIYYLDGIIIGSLLSICMFKGLFPWRLITKYKVLLHVVAIPVILVFFNNLLFFSVFNSVISSILIALLIASNLTISDDAIFRFLNWRALKKIGILSYSIYIWQQLIVFRFGNIFNNDAYRWPGNIVCIGILALVSSISYNFYEKRFLQLKRTFTKISTSNVDI